METLKNSLDDSFWEFGKHDYRDYLMIFNLEHFYGFSYIDGVLEGITIKDFDDNSTKVSNDVVFQQYGNSIKEKVLTLIAEIDLEWDLQLEKFKVENEKINGENKRQPPT